MHPQISEGQDEATILNKLESLQGNGWSLQEETRLVKTYNFKTYTKVLDMHHVIGTRSKSENHHPIMTTTIGTLEIHWMTHEPRGLSDKDVRMAEYCDEQASHIGTVKSGETQKCGPSNSTL